MGFAGWQSLFVWELKKIYIPNIGIKVFLVEKINCVNCFKKFLTFLKKEVDNNFGV